MDAFQIVGLDVYVHRLILGLGIFNFVMLLAVFFSCRTVVNFLRMMTNINLTEGKAYRAFYKYHAYYWGILAVSVFLHVLVAITHGGFW